MLLFRFSKHDPAVIARQDFCIRKNRKRHSEDAMSFSVKNKRKRLEIIFYFHYTRKFSRLQVIFQVILKIHNFCLFAQKYRVDFCEYV